jgi:hypothetical protein
MLKTAPIPTLASGQSSYAQQQARLAGAGAVPGTSLTAVSSDVKKSSDGAVSMSFSFAGVPPEAAASSASASQVRTTHASFAFIFYLRLLC